MPREFFTTRGEPENKAHLEELTKASINRNKEKIITDPEIQEAINKINFDTLKNIFLQISDRSGTPPGKMHFVSPDRIFIKKEKETSNTAGSDTLGDYNHKSNVINLYQKKFREFYPEKKMRSVAILHAIIHEETHAVGHQRTKGLLEGLDLIRNNKDETTRYKIKDEIGYATLEYGTEGFIKKEPFDRNNYLLFNEGVTEHLAQRVLGQYLEREKEFAVPKNIRQYKKSLVSDHGILFYAIPVELIQRLVNTISQYAGVPQQIVWQGIDRGYMEGTDLADEEFKKLFADCLPNKFFDRLAEAKTTQEYARLSSELKDGYVPPGPGVIQRFLQQLRIEISGGNTK